MKRTTCKQKYFQAAKESFELMDLENPGLRVDRLCLCLIVSHSEKWILILFMYEWMWEEQISVPQKQALI